MISTAPPDRTNSNMPCGPLSLLRRASDLHRPHVPIRGVSGQRVRGLTTVEKCVPPDTGI